MDNLRKAQIVDRSGQSYAIKSTSRDVLEEVITIEAKVAKWRVALTQAIRNGIFSHRSYVALPSHVAHRVRDEVGFQRFGIGILAVQDTDVYVVRRSRHRTPRVWVYYYQLALAVARHHMESQNAVRRANR